MISVWLISFKVIPRDPTGWGACASQQSAASRASRIGTYDDIAYPAKLKREAEGGYTVTFRDLGEAIAYGESEAEALERAEEVLADALSYYAEKGDSFPKASAPKRREKLVFLPSSSKAKLALWAHMSELRLSKVELAARLGVDEKAVRRMLRLDNGSGVDKIEAALVALPQADGWIHSFV